MHHEAVTKVEHSSVEAQAVDEDPAQDEDADFDPCLAWRVSKMNLKGRRAMKLAWRRVGGVKKWLNVLL
eukprot:3943003-Amphidinium_carterae.1